MIAFYKSKFKLLIKCDFGTFLRHALELLKFISFHSIQLTNGLLLHTSTVQEKCRE